MIRKTLLTSFLPPYLVKLYAFVLILQVKAFMGDVEDLIRWMSDFKTGMRASGPMGALPDTAQGQFDKFMVRIQRWCFWLEVFTIFAERILSDRLNKNQRSSLFSDSVR